MSIISVKCSESRRSVWVEAVWESLVAVTDLCRTLNKTSHVGKVGTKLVVRLSPFLSMNSFTTVPVFSRSKLSFGLWDNPDFKKRERIFLVVIPFSLFICFFPLPVGEIGECRLDKQERTWSYPIHNRNTLTFSNISVDSFILGNQKGQSWSLVELALEYQTFSLFLQHPLESMDLALLLCQLRSWMQPLRPSALPCSLVKGLPSFHYLPCSGTGSLSNSQHKLDIVQSHQASSFDASFKIK